MQMPRGKHEGKRLSFVYRRVRPFHGRSETLHWAAHGGKVMSAVNNPNTYVIPDPDTVLAIAEVVAGLPGADPRGPGRVRFALNHSRAAGWSLATQAVLAWRSLDRATLDRYLISACGLPPEVVRGLGPDDVWALLAGRHVRPGSVGRAITTGDAVAASAAGLRADVNHQRAPSSAGSLGAAMPVPPSPAAAAGESVC